MKIINTQLLKEVAAQAKTSSRRRKNYNFHDSLDANVQRMLNAIDPHTYVQPHKHENPDKVEVFIIMTGRALVVEFDDNGDITSHCLLNASEGVLATEIAPRTWHTIISMVTGTVVYELKDGPYSVLDDKNFAQWAPKEGDIDCDDYIQSVLRRCC